METEFKAIHEAYSPYTLTTLESMYGLYKAADYVSAAGIPGDLVECGVWKGGSSMLMAHMLVQRQDTDRRLYLYDTFAGMSQPTGRDKTIGCDTPAMKEWMNKRKGTHNEWAFAPLDEVRRNMESTGFPQGNIRYVEGTVEETIPRIVPDRIALLRLDTDWFESTHHELKHLFPLVSPGGVIVVDDYGHFSGAKEAVDLYLRENSIPLLLNRIDYTVRMGIKR